MQEKCDTIIAVAKMTTDKNEWCRVLFACAFSQSDEQIIAAALEALPVLAYSHGTVILLDLIAKLLDRAEGNFSVSFVAFHYFRMSSIFSPGFGKRIWVPGSVPMMDLERNRS